MIQGFPSVLLLIPAYNEENRIGPVLRSYAEFFRAHYQGKFQLVVVLNGCRDNTMKVVQSVAAEFREVSGIVQSLLFERLELAKSAGYGELWTDLEVVIKGPVTLDRVAL